jgi:2-oxoglutarate ferredoxin oxidoreductase subunit beta
VDVLQACPTYNKFATHEYLLEHCYDAWKEGHDPTNFQKARALAVDTSKRIATGVLYQNEDVPNFYEELAPRRGVTTTPVEEVGIKDVSDYMKDFI